MALSVATCAPVSAMKDKMTDDAQTKDMFDDAAFLPTQPSVRHTYRARTITSDVYLGPLPDWITKIARRLYDETRLFDRIPEQVIVNEYCPGQGIALHADRRCFGGAVATISLGDDWEMKFRPVKGASMPRAGCASRRKVFDNGG